MAEITASMVKELRDRTGAAMMLCKEALTESGGDMNAAVVYIRKKTSNKLTDRGDRAAAEGVIAIALVDGQDGAIVELNSETDFVARNQDFKRLARELAEQVARQKGHSVETVLTQDSIAQPGATVQARIEEVFSRLRERIVFRRFEFISTDETGLLAAYVHVPANDKIGVLVELGAGTAAQAKSAELQQLGKEIAMQIAGARPKYLTRDEVSPQVLETERDIARTTALQEGRPEAAIEKIVEGRLRKFYEETVLLDQAYQRDPKKSISQLLKEAGQGVSIRRFARYQVGEELTGVSTSGAIKETAE